MINLDYMCCFYSETTPTELYTLSLHDALPILQLRGRHPHQRVGRSRGQVHLDPHRGVRDRGARHQARTPRCGSDRKSTRLNSSHEWISYAVFCLKKKNKDDVTDTIKNYM